MRALAVVLVLMAGCSQLPVDAPDVTEGEPLAAVAPALELAFDECWAVGGLSIYPLDQYEASVPMPEGIALRDIADLTGDPRVVSANGAGWLTAGDAITGHWHVAIECFEQPNWGFVAIAIEPPVWDDEPAPLNFLVAVWSWDSVLRDEVAAVGHASQALDVQVTGNTFQTTMLLEDDHNGRYEGTFNHALAEPVPIAEHARFWLLLPTDGHHNHHEQTGPFRPVSYDFRYSLDYYAPSSDTTGLFVHSGTDHHAPLPALGGNALGIEWLFADAVVTDGPRPDVALNTTWVH